MSWGSEVGWSREEEDEGNGLQLKDKGMDGGDVLRTGLQLCDGGNEGGHRPFRVLQQERLVPQLPTEADDCRESHTQNQPSIGMPASWQRPMEQCLLLLRVFYCLIQRLNSNAQTWSIEACVHMRGQDPCLTSTWHIDLRNVKGMSFRGSSSVQGSES